MKEVCDQVYNQVYMQIRGLVHDSILQFVGYNHIADSRVWDQVDSRVWDQVRDQVRDQVYTQISEGYED